MPVSEIKARSTSAEQTTAAPASHNAALRN